MSLDSDLWKIPAEFLTDKKTRFFWCSACFSEDVYEIFFASIDFTNWNVQEGDDDDDDDDVDVDDDDDDDDDDSEVFSHSRF